MEFHLGLWSFFISYSFVGFSYWVGSVASDNTTMDGNFCHWLQFYRKLWTWLYIYFWWIDRSPLAALPRILQTNYKGKQRFLIQGFGTSRRDWRATYSSYQWLLTSTPHSQSGSVFLSCLRTLRPAAFPGYLQASSISYLKILQHCFPPFHFYYPFIFYLFT